MTSIKIVGLLLSLLLCTSCELFERQSSSANKLTQKNKDSGPVSSDSVPTAPTPPVVAPPTVAPPVIPPVTPPPVVAPPTVAPPIVSPEAPPIVSPPAIVPPVSGPSADAPPSSPQGAALVSASPNWLNLGKRLIGQTVSQVVALNNTGNLSASLVPEAIEGGNFHYSGGSYPGTRGDCGSSLGASQSCWLDLEFTPNPDYRSQTNYTFKITYHSSTASGLEILIPVAGEVDPGSLVARLSFTEENIDLGSALVGYSVERPFTLYNSGYNPATQIEGYVTLNPTFFGYKGGSYPGIGGTCGPSIAPRTSCTVVVSYSPTDANIAQAGRAFVGVQYFDGMAGDVPTDVYVTATRIFGADLRANGSTFYFGGVEPNMSGIQHIGITNLGGLVATGISVVPLQFPFSLASIFNSENPPPCSGSLEPDDTCSIYIAASPNSRETRISQAEIDYTDVSGGQKKLIFDLQVW